MQRQPAGQDDGEVADEEQRPDEGRQHLQHAVRLSGTLHPAGEACAARGSGSSSMEAADKREQRHNPDLNKCTRVPPEAQVDALHLANWH